MKIHKITIAKGDGIGPEIMDATLNILKAANTNLELEEIEIGEKVYKQGHTSGIRPESWDSLRKNKVFLKAPITTPQGSGYKSLNVTIRKTLGLFANVRPCRSFHPYISTKHPILDLVIIRENEEDLYAGIEHQQTSEVVQCLKLITKPGTEKIVRYAFEYACSYGREKVTCMVKDNIMKHTDGLFHETFKEIAKEYPEIEANSQIIDIGAALLAERPENYDVVVTLNLYGDIISDIAAQIAGSVGLAGSSNIGEHIAMFEAIHGSAPDITGKNLANPSGLLNAAIMMLVHLGEGKIAELIENAWLKTLEDGIHTTDIYKEGTSKKKVGTKEFAEEVIQRLGQSPSYFKKSNYEKAKLISIPEYKPKPSKKELVGVDVFVDFEERDPNKLGKLLVGLAGPDFQLKLITNRGVKVYPGGAQETFCTNHWRCRFVKADAKIFETGSDYPPIDKLSIPKLLEKLISNGIDIIKTENLYTFDGKRGFTLGQGE